MHPRKNAFQDATTHRNKSSILPVNTASNQRKYQLFSMEKMILYGAQLTLPLLPSHFDQTFGLSMLFWFLLISISVKHFGFLLDLEEKINLEFWTSSTKTCTYHWKKFWKSIEGHTERKLYEPLLKIEWILIIHNNCIFPYNGYSLEIVGIYYFGLDGFSGAIANFIEWISYFFPVIWVTMRWCFVV